MYNIQKILTNLVFKQSQNIPVFQNCQKTGHIYMVLPENIKNVPYILCLPQNNQTIKSIPCLPQKGQCLSFKGLKIFCIYDVYPKKVRICNIYDGYPLKGSVWLGFIKLGLQFWLLLISLVLIGYLYILFCTHYSTTTLEI